MKFDWDGAKRLANIVKHGISFDDVDLVFADSRSIIYSSPREGEERFVIIGMLRDRLVSVVFTPRNEAIRIISARAARPQEKALWLKNASKPS